MGETIYALGLTEIISLFLHKSDLISRDIYLPHGWFLFLVVHGQWGFPVAHCLTGSDLSAHLFHFGLHVSVLPEGNLGWEPSAQGVLGFTPPGHTFSSLAQRLNSRSATAKARRADSVKMINLMLMVLLLLPC